MSIHIGDRVRLQGSDLEGIVIDGSDSGATLHVLYENGTKRRHPADQLLPCDPEKAPENTEPVRLLARRVYSSLQWTFHGKPTFRNLTAGVDALIDLLEEKEAELRTAKEKLAAIESALRS